MRSTTCILIVLVLLPACARKSETDAVPADDIQTAKNEKLVKPMKDALERYDWGTVKELLEKGADPNMKGEYGVTALLVASRYGTVEIVELLLAKGADPNARNHRGLTPLHTAADHERDQVVQLLIEHRADPNARDDKGWTPLYYAIRRRKGEIVESLLESGADVNVKDNRGYTPLDLTSGFGELLKKHGAKSGQPLSVELFKAVQSEDVDKVRELLGKGADPNAVSPEGWSALSLLSHRFEQTWAGSGFSKESGKLLANIARVLVEHGADVNGGGKDDIPLFHAASSGNRAVAEFLVEAGADINARGKYGDTALHKAAEWGNRETVEYFLSLGIDVMARDIAGNTPLHSAFFFAPSKEAVELLVSHGADVSAVSKQGETPLHRAMSSCLGTDAVAILVSKGADVNAKTGGGYTPLHLAALYGKGHAVEFLLSKGADANIANKDGKLPRELAKDDWVKKMFEQHAGKNDE